jgi:hypothetical protein
MPEKRRQSKEAETLFSPKTMDSFIQQAMQYGWLFKLKELLDRYGVYMGISVTRNSSHYFHAKTVSVDIEDDWGGAQDPETGEPPSDEIESDILALVAKLRDHLQEAVETISNKIYRELEKEYEYSYWGEGAEDSIRANEYEFDEYGERLDGGGYQYDQLDGTGKVKAKEWWASTSSDDTYWYESLLDDWKERLEEMGFGNPDIGFSGFSSQGDGASFTASSFELDDFIQYVSTGKGKDISL